MSSARPPSAEPSFLTSPDRYRQAGMLAIGGGVLLAVHAIAQVATGDRLPGVLPAGSLLLCGAVVSLAVTIRAQRGRNLGIALGMIGAVAGAAGALSDLIQGTGGLPATASLVLAFAGSLIVGLSFPKPRSGYPQAAVFAALSGAALLVLKGGIGVLDDDLAELGFLVPALVWAYLGKVALGDDPLPRPVATPAPTKAAGQRPQARKPRPKRRPKRR